ncbi:LacI family DNA-binding transcriptional regulator [Sphingobacterium kyonggiense]|uniref:LacI family DNA-binding transcriptional regulator n=1 Tax=Sphingobacterium kyonggiense TaxID=714075 RepID=A0ABP7Z6S9_9SPHI
MRISELSGVKEIARRANVSIATVDRVLHSRPGVAEKTKSKILDIIDEIKYKPNILAKRLASKRVYKFGILIPNDVKESGYWQAPITGIESALSEFGEFGVELSYFLYDKDDRNSFVDQIEELFKGPIDGIIVAPIFIKESLDLSIRCIEKRIQYVFIDTNILDAKPLSFIGFDLFQSGRVVGNLCNYLLEEDDGILVVNIAKHEDSLKRLKLRYEGFEAYMKEYNREKSIKKIDFSSASMHSFETRMTKALQNKKTKLIFVTGSHVHLVGHYLKKRNIKDLLVIGYEYSTPNLEFLIEGYIDFLICQKPIEQGYRAFVALYEHFIAKRKVDKMQFMPIDVVTRENFKYYEY